MGKMGIYVRTSVDKDNTSIEQQIKIGKDFCKKNKFEFEVYQDVGKSGYLVDDEKEPFKHRPGMKKLIEDIEDKIIDKVWVFEFSRLSRNDYTSFLLKRIFTRNSITIYENDRPFDMDNPLNQMIQGMVSLVNQYERHDIVRRSKRGVTDTINRGIRGFQELYGYKKEGITNIVSIGEKTKKYMKWTPVNSEIENLRYLFQEYLKGKSVKIIVTDIYKNKITEKQRITLIKKFGRLLRQFVYTGFSLNTDGLEIYNKYMKCEIDSINKLKDKKYYVKSITFPVKIVSIENWIKCVEKSHVHKLIYKDKMRRTDTEILTGIIMCPYCELRYYLYNDHNYYYYKHFSKKSCGQKPKSFDVEKMNNLFSVFFFYFYLVYDDTKNLIKENQRIIKLNLLEIEDKIKTLETENKKLEKQVEKFQTVYEDFTDGELLKLTLIKETEVRSKISKNNDTVLILNNELEELNKKYDQDELEMTCYNVKENIINYFEKMTTDEKRTILIKIIKNSQIFGKYIVIDTKKLLFIFDTGREYILPESIYNKFKKDRNFKNNFLNSSNIVDSEGDFTNMIWELIGTGVNSKDYKTLEKTLSKKYTQKQIDISLKNLVSYILVRQLNDITIKEYFLKSTTIFDLKIIMEKKLDKLGIKYDLTGIEKIISFTEL